MKLNFSVIIIIFNYLFRFLIIHIIFHFFTIRHYYLYFLNLNDSFFIIFFEIKFFYTIKLFIFKLLSYLYNNYCILLCIFTVILDLFKLYLGSKDKFYEKLLLNFKYLLASFLLIINLYFILIIYSFILKFKIHYFISEIEIFLFSYSIYTFIYIFYSILNRFFFFLIINAFKKKIY